MNLNKTLFSLSFALFSLSAFGQQDGYWDKERATKKEILVSARDRIVVKTDEFPVGTTELVYRITLLDENQQLASSLVSVLKSIPDPTGISQGSAGAIFLLSKITGNDKCKYAIFSNEINSSEYVKKGLVDKSCYVQKESVNKDANRISVDKSSCLTSKTDALWFGFESSNWIMKQKIILEVVPWVNTKLSRGWNLENRKKTINDCKNAESLKSFLSSETICLCVLEKFQKEYTFQELQQLLGAEKSKKTKDFIATCFEETGESKKKYSEIRQQALKLMEQEKYGEVITKLQTLIADNKATALDCNTLGYALICTKQFDKALKNLKEAEKLDATELSVQLNLAHVYLLKNNFRLAKSIHKKYKNQNVTDSLSWTQKAKSDFETFKKIGLSSDDFDRVLRLLKN